jgi:hypothetical protein
MMLCMANSSISFFLLLAGKYSTPAVFRIFPHIELRQTIFM